jgi:hypothetical protein
MHFLWSWRVSSRDNLQPVRRKSKQPPAVSNADGCVIKQAALTPIASYPNTMVSAITPVGTDPDGARMRPGGPTSTHPHPTSTPFPSTGYPEPNVRRTGCDSHVFCLRRWRRGGVVHDRWWRGRGSLVNHATGQQRQARSNQKAFSQKVIFHSQLFRRGGIRDCFKLFSSH